MSIKHIFNLRSRWAWVIFPVVGLASLVWFLVRVIPKPSRADYPCQRVAFPLASSFVLWLTGVVASVLAFRRAKLNLLRSKLIPAAACLVIALVGVAMVALHTPQDTAQAFSAPALDPVGTGKGIHPGRVAWVYDSTAAVWDGSSNYWWQDAWTKQDKVESMLSRSLQWISGEATDAAAWDAIFRHYNSSPPRNIDVGYTAGDGICIKVNGNNCKAYADNDNQADPAPATIMAVVKSLIDYGVPQEDIVVYDASRWMPDKYYNKVRAVYPNVTFVDNRGLYGRVKSTPDTTKQINWSPGKVTDTGTTGVIQELAASKYLINLGCMKKHSLAGVTFVAKNHFGSLYRSTTTTDSGWKPSTHMHNGVTISAGYSKYSTLVDIQGWSELGGKAVLNIVDSLYACKQQGETAPSRMTIPGVMSSMWTSSLVVSLDWVAAESVCVDIINAAAIAEPSVWSLANYSDNALHEAAQADDPPSGSVYEPDGTGIRLSSLGVHEHWNNANDKQYSRNLGYSEGIELVMASPGLCSIASAPAVVAKGRTIALDAAASPPDGASITKVEFYAGATKIGEDASAPYTVNWSTNSSGYGIHAVTAKAIFSNGKSTTSMHKVVKLMAAGDANMDWSVDATDVSQVLAAGKYETGPDPSVTWADGDFDGDGDVDFDDMYKMMLTGLYGVGSYYP